MQLDIHAPKDQANCGRLNLFSLYTDLPASVCTRWAGTRIGLMAGQSWLLRSDIWKLDTLLASNSMKQMATATAASADILIIAIGSLEQRDENLVQWLDSVVVSSTNLPTPKLLIGLLGAEDAKASQLDWNVKHLMRCARAMTSDFIWHWMGKDAMADADFMTESIGSLLAAKSGSPIPTSPLI